MNISSEFDLFEKNCSRNPDVHILLEKVDDEFFQEITSGNGFWIGQNTFKNEITIKWDNTGKFRIEDGCKIVVDPETKNKNLLNTYLMGPVMAMLLHQRDFLVLHGSAIETDSGIVAFLGPSGFGKSTIAAILSNNGYKVISDDILAIRNNTDNKPFISPGFPQLKLSSASIESIWKNKELKLKAIDPDEHFINFYQNFPDYLPLKKIYILKKLIIRI